VALVSPWWLGGPSSFCVYIGHLDILFGQEFVQVLASCFYWIVPIFFLWFVSVLSYSKYKFFARYMFYKHLFSVYRLPFHFSWWTKIINFQVIQFIIFFYPTSAFYMLCEKALQIPREVCGILFQVNEESLKGSNRKVTWWHSGVLLPRNYNRGGSRRRLDPMYGSGASVQVRDCSTSGLAALVWRKKDSIQLILQNHMDNSVIYWDAELKALGDKNRMGDFFGRKMSLRYPSGNIRRHIDQSWSRSALWGP
jgi:hypothetical protein